MGIRYTEWSAELQLRCIDSICRILDKFNVPYYRNKMNRPRQQLMLPPLASTEALLAVYAHQQVEIEMLRGEIYKLRGMTKNEWKEAEDLLHSTERN